MISGQFSNGVLSADEHIGVSKKEYAEIVVKLGRLAETDIAWDAMNDIVKDCNPYDVMVGFKLATLLYKNEGRL